MRGKKRAFPSGSSAKCWGWETTYSPYERRQRKMDVDMLIQICKLLDLSADEILGLK